MIETHSSNSGISLYLDDTIFHDSSIQFRGPFKLNNKIHNKFLCLRPYLNLQRFVWLFVLLIAIIMNSLLFFGNDSFTISYTVHLDRCIFLSYYFFGMLVPAIVKKIDAIKSCVWECGFFYIFCFDIYTYTRCKCAHRCDTSLCAVVCVCIWTRMCSHVCVCTFVVAVAVLFHSRKLLIISSFFPHFTCNWTLKCVYWSTVVLLMLLLLLLLIFCSFVLYHNGYIDISIQWNFICFFVAANEKGIHFGTVLSIVFYALIFDVFIFYNVSWNTDTQTIDDVFFQQKLKQHNKTQKTEKNEMNLWLANVTLYLDTDTHSYRLKIFFHHFLLQTHAHSIYFHR